MRMQAVVMTGHGGPEALELVEVEAPRVGTPHDVLVRVLACGVNRADVQARGRPFGGDMGGLTSGGLIPGLEGTGVVEEVGGAVTRFSPGAEVYYADGGFGLRHGSYSQYKVVDERYLARKPLSLDFPSAAAAPVVLITAWEALFERARVKAGDFVLIHAGAGGVGHIAVQLAARRGARVAATVSTDIKAGLAASLGAERVIRYSDENVLAALREWTGKDGANVVFDTVGGHNFAASFEQKRRLVELLIDRVIVTEEEVEIRYVMPTSGSGEHGRFCHLRTNYLLQIPAILPRCRRDDARARTRRGSLDGVSLAPEVCPGN